MPTLCPLFSSKRMAPRVMVVAALGAVSACGGTSGSSPAPVATPAHATEAEWRALATPRPNALPDAPRVSLGAVELLGAKWDAVPGVTWTLGVSELVTAGLLRRQDVVFVERRRFEAAVEAARRGEARPRGAPEPGVSPGAEFIATATWASVGLDSAYLDLRVTDAETGSVVSTWRLATANDADPAALARSVVSAVLAALDAVGRLPVWTDPEADAAPGSYRSSGVPLTAVRFFLRGLAEEERWNWEGARVAYQSALTVDGAPFHEARAALARTARLRMGGTLGAN